jgi:selenocysteine-specific translation elongation factor
MANLNVAILGPEGYAKSLGKPGTTSDITLYNLKREDDTVTFVEPTRYPEKLAPLFYAVSLADLAILVVEEIGPVFGECVLMLGCAEVRAGLIILKNYISREEVAPLLKGTLLESYDFVEDDPGTLREILLEKAAAKTGPAHPETIASGAVPVDHAFPVKGIGTVVLGMVSRGVVRRHDTMHILPGPGTAQVRSIQKHDDDAVLAFQGDRVGLALKGVEADQLTRGDVLTNDPDITSSATITGRGALVKYWPNQLKEGMVLYIGHWMQFLPSKVAYVNNAGDWRRPELTLRLERELVYLPGASAVLHYLEGGKLRVVGTISIS